MLDLFAQLFQHYWGQARSLRMVYKDLCVVSFPRCTAGPNIAYVCTPLPTLTQQLPTLLAQQCWELLRLFARSVRKYVGYNNSTNHVLGYLQLVERVYADKIREGFIKR